MSGPHVFVDESKHRGFLLAAAVLLPGELEPMRQALARLRLPGQRRIHFTRERDGRRRQIVAELVARRTSAVVYQAPQGSDVRGARDLTLARLVDDLAAAGAARLVIELDDQAQLSDRRVIRDRLALAGGAPGLRYAHLRAHEECLLAIPDAVAWCWAKGGHWRRQVAPIVTRAVRL